MVDPQKPAEEEKKGGDDVEENSTEARFNILKGWSQEQGVLGLDQINFPVGFTDDFSPADKKFTFTGVQARRDFKHRESIIAVPFDCLISPKTFEKEEPELYEYVIRECPELFDEKEQNDYEQLMITFFLMHEHSKGKASKWYPYIISMPQEQEFFCDWDEKYIDACQDS